MGAQPLPPGFVNGFWGSMERKKLTLPGKIPVQGNLALNDKCKHDGDSANDKK